MGVGAMADQPPMTTVWRDDGPGLSRLLFCAEGGASDSPAIDEIWHEFAHAPSLVGAVHRARITQIFSAQNRMVLTLIDGTPVNCRIAKGAAPAAIGDVITITITAPPREGKPYQAMVGARLVSCWFVLLPGQSGVQHSRALTPAPAAEIVAAVEATIAAAPFACGVIMRRGTALLSAGELTAHLAEMIAEWHNAVGPMMPADTTINQAPACLFDGGTVARRIGRHVGPVAIRSTGVTGDLDDDAFEAAYEAAIDEATGATVALPSGGVIWIEPTHALCAIDLDSGSGTIAALVDEAPAVIARHWRLRGLGGLVAVDVPRLPPAGAQKFTTSLAAAAASDPRHPDILGRSRGGILEVRIPHGVLPLHGLLATPGVTAILAVLRVLRMIDRRPTIATPHMAVSPAVAELLQGPLADALASLDRHVTLVVSSDLQHAELRE